MIQNKKASIILILKILEEYSDEEHFLTHKQIIDYVYRDYNIELERKSVAYSLNLLIELGYDIVKSPKGGYALFSRLFDRSEITFLSDAIFSSKVIPGKNAILLCKKINSVLSKYERKDYSYIYKSDEINRTNNKEIFYNIELIHEAIVKKKRIGFQYITYDENGNAIPRMDGYHFKVSPYFLVNNFGHYYLLANYREKYKPIQVYRLDYIVNIEILNDDKYKSLNEIGTLKNFKIYQYLNEHIYLFGSEVLEATLEILNPYAIQYLYDWFGNNLKILKKDDKLITKIKCSEDALFYWVLQYGKNFKVLEPTSLIERIKSYHKEEIQKY